MLTFNHMAVRPLGGPTPALRLHVQSRNGLRIPALGLGTYRLSPIDAAAAVRVAVGEGFRHFDCAPVYQNEDDVGRALEAAASAGGVPREDLFITSKLWPTSQQADRVEAACRASIAALRCAYLDLYLLHWPVAWRAPGGFKEWFPTRADGTADVDPSVSLSDTWRAMEGLVEKGLVRHIGLCNARAAHVEAVCGSASIAPAAHQVEFHPAHFDMQTKNLNLYHGMVTVAHSPMGMPTRFTPPEYSGLLHHSFLKPLEQRVGFSPARLLLNWNVDLHNAVVVKAASEAHIRDCSKAQRFALDNPVRWAMAHVADQVVRMRVMNPFGFDGRPQRFFD